MNPYFPRLWRLINYVKENVPGGYSFIAKWTEEFAENRGKPFKKVTRETISNIHKNGDDVQLTLSQLLTLHEFFSSLSKPDDPTDFRLFQEDRILDWLRLNRTTIYQVCYPQEFDRFTISIWDSDAIDYVRTSLNHNLKPTPQLDLRRISTESAQNDWRDDVEDDKSNLNLFAFGSPRAHEFSQVMLGKMFGMYYSSHGKLPPFRFFWPEKMDRLKNCPFVISSRKDLKDKFQDTLSPNDRVFEYEDPSTPRDQYAINHENSDGWDSYAAIAVQRRGKRLFAVFAGHSAVDTYSASQEFASFNRSDGKSPIVFKSLPDLDSENSKVVWWVVKTRIVKTSRIYRTPIDRDTKASEIVSGPNVWG